MKILYVTTISNTVNSFLIPHIRMLIEEGHNVDLAFNIIEEVHSDLIELGCIVHNIEFQRDPLNKKNFLAYKKIKKLIQTERYDLVHTHTPVASALVRSACINLKKVKIIYTAHGFHFFQGASLINKIIYSSVEKILSRWTDTLITMNEEDFKNAKKMKLRRKSSAYYINGVGIDLRKFKPQNDYNKSKLRAEYGYKESDLILIYVAELSYRKNQELLIDAISMLKNKVPNIKLLLVGRGPLKEKYKEQVNKLGLEGIVEFLGFRTDISNLMIISDLAVSSSRQEGLPVNIMEAMATGLPLVVTNSRGNRDLVKHGENGFVVENNNAIQLSEAIEKVLMSDEIKRAFRSSSLKRVQIYTIERIIEEMREIYLNYSNM